VSIGDTTHGRLANGRELTESASLKILPRQKERDLRYGTEQLVALLSHAGTALFEKTQTPLWVGNLGRRDGGDIEWSVSHNAGRDADVAFCYRDVATGKPATPKDLVQIFQDGLSKDKTLAFDTARTWVVVKALVEFQGASLQYLFISDALKKKLLEHARTIKEPAAIIERAAELLRQPGAAAAHDDHLHVRVYCSQMDAAGGCRDQGVVHPFAKTFEAEREKAAGKARKQLADARPTRRRRALLRLGLVGDARDVPAGLSYLADPAPEVRVAASELVAALGKDEHTPKLIDRFQVEDDSAVLAALVESIGFLGGKDAGVFFRDVLLATASAEVLGFSAKAIPLDAATAPYFLGLASDPYPPMRSLLAPTPVVDLTFDRSALQRLSVRAVLGRLGPLACGAWGARCACRGGRPTVRVSRARSAGDPSPAARGELAAGSPVTRCAGDSPRESQAHRPRRASGSPQPPSARKTRHRRAAWAAGGCWIIFVEQTKGLQDGPYRNRESAPRFAQSDHNDPVAQEEVVADFDRQKAGRRLGMGPCVVADEVACLSVALRAGANEYFTASSYDTADKSFTRYVEDHLPKYSLEDLEFLLAGIETNRQVYDRGKPTIDRPKVRARCLTLSPAFDFSRFPRFEASHSES
jgi:penicillin-insensitive murein endopeptidase